MKTVFQPNALTLAGACLLSLYGCGGGGGSGLSDVPATPSPAPVVLTTTDVLVSVIDGPIQNATVCMDKNNNGVCDAGEPTGKTDATGKVTLKVDLADAGKFPILAVVGADAIDAETGAVPTAYTLKAPADKPSVVTPLTTLVQSVVDSTGLTSDVAESQVRAQTGINVSLFEDFSKSTSTDSQAAAVIARMLVVTTQQQAGAIAPALGTLAIDGATIKQADLDKAIQNKLLETLPSLLVSLADPAVLAAATAKEREAALLTAAKRMVADTTTGLTVDGMATLVAIGNQRSAAIQETAFVPAADVNLRFLNFTDAANYSMRIITRTLAQNTPDAAGYVRDVQRRYSSLRSATAAWTNLGVSALRQSDVYYNGKAWVTCALNSENSGTVLDAKGRASYSSCDSMDTGISNRSTFDVSGRPMLDVYNQIIKSGATNLAISAPTLALSDAKFPADSKLSYQSGFSLTQAVAYYPGSSNVLFQYSVEVSAGGVAANQPAGAGCNSAELTGNGTSTKTFEDMIARAPGSPCIFGLPGSFTYNGVTYTNPEASNEQWGPHTLFLGTVGTAPVGTGVAADYFTTNKRLRVGFKGSDSNSITYYSCKERFNNGSTRNCKSIGTGTYTIATQGDARVMTFNNLPLEVNALDFQRVMVERGGRIYYGYKNKAGAFGSSARFNAAGTAAFLAQLGLPAVDLNTPLALTKASYAGNWDLFDPTTQLKSTLVQIFSTGDSSCTDTDATVTPAINRTYACVVTFSDLSNGVATISQAGATRSSAVNFGFLTGVVTGTVSDTATPGSVVSFKGERR